MSDAEGNPIYAMLLGQSQFVGPSEQLEDTLEPIPAQYEIGPGNKCLAATANTMLEEDFTVLEVLEPDSRPDLFEDWEQRAGGLAKGGSHVLAQWFSVDHPEGDIGWFPRTKLIQITEESFAAANTWRTEGFPEHPPKWIEEAFTSYTDAVSHMAPETIPVLVTCGNPNCESREVDLHITGRKHYSGRAGQVTKDGKTIYIPLNEPEAGLTWRAHLVCNGCKSTKVLEEKEWELPPS